jgi:hypothetical protein
MYNRQKIINYETERKHKEKIEQVIGNVKDTQPLGINNGEINSFFLILSHLIFVSIKIIIQMTICDGVVWTEDSVPWIMRGLFQLRGEVSGVRCRVEFILQKEC